MNMPTDLKDEKLKAVIKYIVNHPGESFYQIKKGSGIDRITIVRKIKSQYRLVENGYLRIEKGRRNAERCWLTFKGLLYSIRLGALDPEEGASVRKNHRLDLPKVPDPAGKIFGSLIKTVEENFPGAFYGELIFDLNFPDGLIEFWPSFAVSLAVGKLLTANRQDLQKYIKGKNLVLPDGTVFKDFESVFKVFMMMYEGRTSQHVQDQNQHTELSKTRS